MYLKCALIAFACIIKHSATGWYPLFWLKWLSGEVWGVYLRLFLVVLAALLLIWLRPVLAVGRGRDLGLWRRVTLLLHDSHTFTRLLDSDRIRHPHQRRLLRASTKSSGPTRDQHTELCVTRLYLKKKKEKRYFDLMTLPYTKSLLVCPHSNYQLLHLKSLLDTTLC